MAKRKLSKILPMSFDDFGCNPRTLKHGSIVRIPVFMDGMKTVKDFKVDGQPWCDRHGFTTEKYGRDIFEIPNVCNCGRDILPNRVTAIRGGVVFDFRLY